MHYLSDGAVGFTRGLNDTQQLVVLFAPVEALAPNVWLALVTVTTAIGCVASARKVAESMSSKIALINAGHGFTSNLVT